MNNEKSNTEFDETAMTGSTEIGAFTEKLVSEYEFFINSIEFPKFLSAKKENEFNEKVIDIGMFGTEDDKKEFLSKHRKKNF